MTYLLDTNVVVIYVRSNQQSRNLEADLQLMIPDNNLVVSAVTVGEVKSLAHRNNWGIKKLQKLELLLNRFLIASINVEEVMNMYAEIDAYSQGKFALKKFHLSARNMGKNDLWIAATAKVLNLTLITTDNDFNHLENDYLKLMKVDLANFKTTS